MRLLVYTSVNIHSEDFVFMLAELLGCVSILVDATFPNTKQKRSIGWSSPLFFNPGHVAPTPNLFRIICVADDGDI